MMLVVWWLIPLYDRVPLFVVSRALFGDVPKVREVMRAWPKLLIRRLLFALVIGRFSPARGLSLPVAELEGLRGKAYRQRVDLLERNGGEGATMATISGMVLWWVCFFGTVGTAMMMVPEVVQMEWVSGMGDFFTFFDTTDIPDGFFWMLVALQMFVITLMEPFYVSAGFALYINSRTLTEGWDIELAFKRLGSRLASLAGKVAVVMAVGFSCFSSLAEAAPDTSKEKIEAIMDDEDFIIHHRYVDVPVEEPSNDSDSGWLDWLSDLFSGSGVPDFMGAVGTVFFYVILAVLIVGIIFLIIKNAHVFRGGGGWRRGVKIEPKTVAVMGMDVSPESLPDDIAGAARDAWRAGDFRLALSLLYRGSLAWMVYRAELPIEESDTEGDCLARVAALQDPNQVRYFSELTGQWIALAYGKIVPDDHAMVSLCEQWPFDNQVKHPRGGERSEG
ncbi:DUF4129 domain-containing protein [Verrucomicrobiaceae bacterium N1E253]|uniref:DUF4129 domain-containing protein n=1 Tax=Oceaniferula marina TaxID=2748318 RepID=A0A851GFP2_9BACT|nr:DUF4129 domain-containing protein [Oceaniferula marina]NWK53987.1 DUF4129 domain-containing protein [Oceaniferula marina]